MVAVVRRAFRRVSRLHGVRDRVPVRRAVRPADRSARARRSSSTTRGRSAIGCSARRSSALLPYPAGCGCSLAPLALYRPGRARLLQRSAAAQLLPRACARCWRSRRRSRGRSLLAASPERTPAVGAAAHEGRPARRLRAARRVSARQRRDRQRAGGRRAARSIAPSEQGAAARCRAMPDVSTRRAPSRAARSRCSSAPASTGSPSTRPAAGRR